MNKIYNIFAQACINFKPTRGNENLEIKSEIKRNKKRERERETDRNRDRDTGRQVRSQEF